MFYGVKLGSGMTRLIFDYIHSSTGLKASVVCKLHYNSNTLKQELDGTRAYHGDRY